jgi:hypothetical protein
MTSLPDDGSSDRDINLQITANPSFGTPLLVDTSPFPLIREPESANATAVASTTSPANAGVALSSSSWYEYMRQFPSPTAHATTGPKGQRTNHKGKGIQRGLDWHLATRDASESEREGKSLFPPVRDIRAVLIFMCNT